MFGEERIPISRRGFLRGGVLLPGLVTLVRLTPASAAAATVAPAACGLNATQLRILSGICERMTDTGDPEMPKFQDTKAMATIEATLALIDPDVRSQFGSLLYLFEWGPLIFARRIAKFTELPAEAQDDYIRGWALSGWDLRRIGFQALKNIAMLGYYSQDETWKGIGYRGPWAPKPRRVPGAV